MITFKPHQALEFIKQYLPANPIIVEAGAFDGKETKKMATVWPHGTIHAFEPVPELFERLKITVLGLTNVYCYQIALSDTTGMAQLYISESPTKPGTPSQANSLLKPTGRLELSPLIFPKTIEVQTITLDAWAQENAIDHIDFLWLDAQGFELNILKASTTILKTVKVIYTEVEFISAYENQYLYDDVKVWLEAQGFCMIAKDFPDQPTWFFGNALFVKI